jgi:hypothetical protein
VVQETGLVNTEEMIEIIKRKLQDKSGGRKRKTVGRS